MLVVLQIVPGGLDPNAFGRLGLLRAVACFPAGVATYRFCFLSRHKGLSSRAVSSIAAGSCLILLASLLTPHAGVAAPLCFTTLIGCLYFQTGRVNNFLGGRLCTFLGEISFPLYLLHEVPVSFLKWLLSTGRVAEGTTSIFVACVLFTVIVLVSVLLNRFVEKPSQRYGRLLLDRLTLQKLASSSR